MADARRVAAIHGELSDVETGCGCVKVANTTAVERQQEQAFVRKHGPLNLRRNLLKKVG